MRVLLRPITIFRQAVQTNRVVHLKNTFTTGIFCYSSNIYPVIYYILPII